MATIPFISILYMYLYGAQPDCLESLAAAKSALAYALSPSSEHFMFFASLLASILFGILTSAVFFFTSHAKFALAMVLVHFLAVALTYSPILSICVALPLMYAYKIFKLA